jgi:hypothetical protein
MAVVRMRIQTLVDTLAARLGRAVVVDDQDLCLVAASEDFGDADASRAWSLMHRRTRPEDVRYEEIKLWTGPGHIPENPALELRRRLCVPVRCGGVLLGFLWITDRCGDLTETQIAAAVRTAAALGPELRRGHGERDVPGRLVEQLLGEEPGLRRGAWEEALDRGLLDDVGQLAVLRVDYAAGDSAAALSEAVERLGRGGVSGQNVLAGQSVLAAVSPGRATVVLGRRQGFGDGSRLAAAAEGLLAGLPGGSGRVGAGGPVRGMEELPRARRQADIALSTAAEGTAACWARLGADALLAQLAPHARENTLLPEGVAALLADPSAELLVPTLITYLDCAGDAQRAARELCLHPTMLGYRLQRAEQISGLSLCDGRDRLLLHLALGMQQLHTGPRPRARRPALPVGVDSVGASPRDDERRVG